MSKELQPIPNTHIKSADGKTLSVMAEVECGTVRFGVDPDIDATYEPWPKEFFLLQSVDMIDYDKVLKAFTDEAEWLLLQTVTTITGANQRMVSNVPDPYGDFTDVCQAITITLEGIVDAANAMALYQEVQKAGHLLLPIERFGGEGNVFSRFVLIPQYEAKYASK